MSYFCVLNNNPWSVHGQLITACESVELRMACIGKQASLRTPKSGSCLSWYRIALSKAELTTHMAPSLINYQCILRSLCMLTIEDS